MKFIGFFRGAIFRIQRNGNNGGAIVPDQFDFSEVELQEAPELGDEAALYKGTVKADRKNERFTVDLSSEIIEQITENGVTTPEHEIPIHILDISRSGVRIQGEELDLKKFDKITIRFTIRKQTKKYYAQIVRIGKTDSENNIIEYGCELLTYQQYNGIM